jgi:translation initiation factor 1 (eIF-1/SUI1)
MLHFYLRNLCNLWMNTAMSKHNKPNTGAPAAKEFKVNPFGALSAAKLAPAAPPAPAPAAPTGKTPPPPARLDRASRELLAAMGGESSVDVGPRKPKVTFQYERKGHGGKEVTVVRGLGEVSQEEQMSILQALKKSLGVGAWFVDNLLLVQGDQTPRLGKWFASAGYRV